MSGDRGPCGCGGDGDEDGEEEPARESKLSIRVETGIDSFGFWGFLAVFVLLVYRCKGISLW